MNCFLPSVNRRAGAKGVDRTEFKWDILCAWVMLSVDDGESCVGL